MPLPARTERETSGLQKVLYAVCGHAVQPQRHARARLQQPDLHVVRIPWRARSSRHLPAQLAILEFDQPTMPGRDVKVGNVRRRARDDEPGPNHLSVAREFRTDAVLAVALATILYIAFLLLSPFAGDVLLFAGLIYFLRSSLARSDDVSRVAVARSLSCQSPDSSMS